MVGALAWDSFHRVASGSDAVDGLEMATAERTDLADLLETLTPEQWESPSL